MDGTKLRQTVTPAGGTAEKTDYSNGYLYRNAALTEFAQPEGRIMSSSIGVLSYEYYLKDHLGNIRVVAGDADGDGIPEVLQEDAYDPWGLRLQGYGFVSGEENRFRYNGKELIAALGLGWYDYGARMYAPDLGRWNGVDALAEKGRRWSPYTYSFNNSLRFIDYDGNWAGDFINEKGRYLGNDGKDDNKVYVIKTVETHFDSDVPSAGISKGDAREAENFIKENSGNSSAFENNSIAYDNSVEIIGDAGVRQGMVDIVSLDNGKGGTSDANNREYGGVIRDGAIIESPAGPVGNPKTDSEASVTHPDVRKGDISFHSHPSGQIFEGAGSGMGTSIGGTITTYQWGRAPSTVDVQGASGNEYVFARGNGTVYIYNSSGVVATIPQDRFITPKK